MSIKKALCVEDLTKDVPFEDVLPLITPMIKRLAFEGDRTGAAVVALGFCSANQILLMLGQYVIDVGRKFSSNQAGFTEMP